MGIDVLPKIDLSIVVLIFLIIIIFLYKSKFNIKDKANKILITIMILSSLVLFLEVLDAIVLQHQYSSLVCITKLINIVGFALSPVVSYLWLVYINKNLDIKMNTKVLITPTIINTILALTTYHNGFIFSINSSNNYLRGPLFMVPILITYLYFMIALFTIKKNKLKIDEKEYRYLILFEIIPIIAILAQVIFIELTIVWSSVGISIIIYYIYIQEKLITYDSLTKLWNRFTFESYVANSLINKRVCFSLIYIDVDDFKLINDTYGHDEGDIALKCIAKFLKDYFINIGKVARIGGDEFIVIVDSCSNIKLDKIVYDMEIELHNYNNMLDGKYNISLSCGYGIFDDKYEDLDSFVKSVDELMYINKKNKKNKNI